METARRTTGLSASDTADILLLRITLNVTLGTAIRPTLSLNDSVNDAVGANFTFLARWVQIAGRVLRNLISKSLVFSSASTPGVVGYFKRESET
jgi:hypothetical protein